MLRNIPSIVLVPPITHRLIIMLFVYLDLRLYSDYHRIISILAVISCSAKIGIALNGTSVEFGEMNWRDLIQWCGVCLVELTAQLFMKFNSSVQCTALHFAPLLGRIFTKPLLNTIINCLKF